MTNWQRLLLIAGLGGTAYFVMKRKRRPILSGLAGDYTSLVADKAEEAIANLRRASDNYREKAGHIEHAWRDWDFDSLVGYEVIDRKLARKAKKELREEES